MGKLEPSCVVGRNENGMVILEKSSNPEVIKHGVTIDQNFPLLGICPRELKIYTHTETDIQIFIAALVTTAKSRSNPDVHQQMNG